MTREEKINSLVKWCLGHACDSTHCRIYDSCQLFTSGDWVKQPDEVIDKFYETLLEGDADKIKAAEGRLQQAEEQLGFKFNMPQCDEVTKMINEREDQTAKADYEIRYDELVVIFCNEEMKATLVEHEPTVSDAVVVTDVVDPGELVVVPAKEFREWLYSRGNEGGIK